LKTVFTQTVTKGRKRMATSVASYRSRQHSLTVKARLEPVREPERLHMTPREVARTIRELIAMGLVEKFQDERGVTRYRSLRLEEAL
jgi:DNA-binding MarR family transcriptional regulator